VLSQIRLHGRELSRRRRKTEEMGRLEGVNWAKNKRGPRVGSHSCGCARTRNRTHSDIV
jgi:hypothetical protein